MVAATEVSNSTLLTVALVVLIACGVVWLVLHLRG